MVTAHTSMSTPHNSRWMSATDSFFLPKEILPHYVSHIWQDFLLQHPFYKVVMSSANKLESLLHTKYYEFYTRESPFCIFPRYVNEVAINLILVVDIIHSSLKSVNVDLSEASTLIYNSVYCYIRYSSNNGFIIYRFLINLNFFWRC